MANARAKYIEATILPATSAIAAQLQTVLGQLREWLMLIGYGQPMHPDDAVKLAEGLAQLLKVVRALEGMLAFEGFQHGYPAPPKVM